MCKHAKDLCARAKVEFTEIEPGAPKQITKPDFQQKYPTVRGYPFIVISQENKPDLEIIGVVELAKYFLKMGLVSAPQK